MKTTLKTGIMGLMAAAAALILTTQAFSASIWDGEITTGVGGVYSTSSNPKLEEYNNLPGGLLGPTGWIGADLGDKRLRADFAFPTENNESLGVGLGLGETDKVSVDINYQRYQHLYGDQAHTLYTETAPGVLTLPPGLAAANQVGNASQQFNNLVTAENATAPSVVMFRDTLGGGRVTYHVLPQLTMNVDGQVKMRQGTRPLSVYENSVINQLPAPIDQRTTDGGLSIEWMPAKTVVRLNGNVSSFEDNISSIHFDDLMWSVPTSSKPSQGLYSQPPSNLAQQAGLFVSLDQIPKTRVTANVAVGRWYQNAAFLPYTADSAATFGYNAVPNPANLGGRVDTFSQQYQVTVMPIQKLKLVARFRGYEMDNRSNAVTVGGKAATGGSATGGNSYPTYFGNRTYTGEGEARYDLLKVVGLNGGYIYQDVFRTDREFAKSIERTVKGGVDVTPVKGVKVALTGSQAQREVSQYNATAWLASGDMPGLRRFDEANRIRKDLGGDLRLSPIKTVNVSYRFTHGTDDFQPNGDLTGQDVGGAVTTTLQYGLLNDKHVMHSVTGDWQVSEKVGLNAMYEHELYNALQADSAGVQDTAHYWKASTEEHYIVYGIGMDADLGSGLSSNLGYTRASSLGRVLMTDQASTATVIEGGLPDTTTLQDDYTAKLTVKLDNTWSLAGSYTLEVYKVNDFANQFQGQVITNPVTGALVGVFLGDHPSNYIASIAGAQVTAKF